MLAPLPFFYVARWAVACIIGMRQGRRDMKGNIEMAEMLFGMALIWLGAFVVLLVWEWIR